MTGCKIWVQKLLDNHKEKLRDKQKVPNQANQIQTQIMIERRNLLFALKEERTILRKSKHALFVKKLWDTIERWNLLFAVMKITSAQMLSALSKRLTHVSLVKVRTQFSKTKYRVFRHIGAHRRQSGETGGGRRNFCVTHPFR